MVSIKVTEHVLPYEMGMQLSLNAQSKIIDDCSAMDE